MHEATRDGKTQTRAAGIRRLNGLNPITHSHMVLAPVVGPLADAGPKARLMMAMNALKVVGVGALLMGLNPLAAFAVIGIGAAAYASAQLGPRVDVRALMGGLGLFVAACMALLQARQARRR